MRITTKSILLISALTTSAFLIYALYKGIILYFVNEALEDTFVGGSTSNISMILWFIISGILMLITSMFLFFLKIKDLKSQKIIVIGLIFFWFTVSFFSIFVTFSDLWITLLTSSIGIISFLASKNLKKEIIAELNKKGLTEKEIYLLQKLAGISKK